VGTRSRMSITKTSPDVDRRPICSRAMRRGVYDELMMIAGGEDREAQHMHPSIASQWPDGELSEIYADGLHCLA
jgi:hypothetical protein